MSFSVVTSPIIVPAWVFTGIALGLALGRFTSRRWLGTESVLGWDDAALAFAMTLCLAGTSLLTAMISFSSRVSPENEQATLPTAFALSLAANSTYSISIPMSKISIAILLVRIFKPSRSTRWILYGGPGFILLLGLVEFPINWLQCSPPPALWNPEKYRNAKCLNPSVPFDLGMVLWGLSAFQDFAFAIYPSFLIYKLQMPRKKKVLFSGLLGLGFFAGAVAIVKIRELAYFTTEAKDPSGLFKFSPWVAFWSCIELCVVISAVSIPSLLPVVLWARQRSRTYWAKLSASDDHNTESKPSRKAVDEDPAADNVQRAQSWEMQEEASKNPGTEHIESHRPSSDV